ncbi:benzoylformate decarboxylase [Mycobacterium sp. 1245111.1]|uniref:benzoylformate decarboxylase n=1 Tax=Mycobacterium sp. 1245111.1 TaxID=1834073 RepID=UPI0007FE959E|nr:benzoylformate decarboxylase [Mycobacterium sp. 1245111.1]OBK35381.1 benzoylformate decarboxylase [Mycobacterium sp. 1245111.1]
MPTVREAFYDVARRLALTTVFGNPGSTEEPFLKDFPADFRYILALQEASAVAMADAYAQSIGRAALVNLHTAAGMGNAMGNIESAWYNRAPLIITAGQQTREMLLLEPYLTNVQPQIVPQPFVKWSYEPARAEDVPAALLRAYATAILPPAGPVFLSIPMDDADQECFSVPLLRKVSRRLPADQEALESVIAALTESRSPALVIGGAVDQAGGWDEAVALAERIRCAVWAAPGEGRPGFPETHPQYRGTLPPAIGPLARALSGHDVIVVIGAPVFRYYPYVPGQYLPDGAELFHITDDPSEAARAPVGTSILADPGRSCAVLAAAVPQANWALPAPRAARVPMQSGDVITAEWLYHTIQTVRPPDSVIVQESLSTLRELREQIPTDRPRSFFSMSSGVLGYGLPAAVGVALAERDEGTNRKVICIVGDGAANYVIQSIWTATQYRLPILFVVVRNGAYNILKSFAELLDTPGVPGLDLPGLDFLGLAQGYGCTAERVTSTGAVAEAVKSGIDADRPHLLEVLVDASVPPLLAPQS